jgi:hypothetical protein
VLPESPTLIYEGHDWARGKEVPNPKSIDQPETTITGGLTQNGVFCQAAHAYKRGERQPERVRVYEKIRQGIWSYNGVFHLEDAWRESDGVRKVFKFKLVAVSGEEDLSVAPPVNPIRRRIIPTRVKLPVWKTRRWPVRPMRCDR